MKTTSLRAIVFASLVIGTTALRLRRPTTKAAVVGCQDNEGRSYKVGEGVESSNPCETMCTCESQGSIMCATMDCLRCRGKVVPVDGQCCGDCYVHDILILPGKGCKKNDTVYEYGDSIPTDNPCESCQCDEWDGVMCAMMACAPCQPPLQNVKDGSCCGKCRDVSTQPVPVGCVVNSNHYNVGPFTHPRNVCKDCNCKEGGTFRCRKKKCPRLKCKESLITSVDGQCCAVCQCEHNGQIYMPGPVEAGVEDACESLVCENGAVTLSRPATCTNIELKCVDPRLGEDCCPYCPNGSNCEVGNAVIRAGGFKKVGKKICTCYTDPWFPNAFCAQKKVNVSLRKQFGDYLADYRSILEELEID